jgi:hypothetical protein
MDEIKRVALVMTGALATGAWLRWRGRHPRLLCDVCFARVDPRAEVCPRCGTVFADTDREQHAAIPEQWVAAQIARLQAMSYDELRAQLDQPQHYEIPLDDERFWLSGETEVVWDNPGKPDGNLRVLVGIWNDNGGFALASDGFMRAPDDSRPVARGPIHE